MIPKVGDYICIFSASQCSDRYGSSPDLDGTIQVIECVDQIINTREHKGAKWAFKTSHPRAPWVLDKDCHVIRREDMPWLINHLRT